MRINRLLLFCAVFIFGCSYNNFAQVQVIETLAGGGGSLGDGGPATAAQLSAPCGYALDATGTKLYIADQTADRIRMIDLTTGIITTVAGSGVGFPVSYGGDGGPATASTCKLNAPCAVAIDAANNLYICDASNSRIRKVTAATGIISTIIGTGTAGFSGDGTNATGAKINTPRGIALDAAGNIYISDAGTNRIRKVDVSGIITSIAGNGTGGYIGEGTPATNYELQNPRGLIVDASGNVYVADMTNNRIRMITPGLTISTYAGNGVAGAANGSPAAGGSAQVNLPSGVNFDNLGNLIISDAGNNEIRKVSGGALSTIAGNGTGGPAVDGVSPIAGQLKGAVNVAYESSGVYYIYDKTNLLIRVVRDDYVPTFTAGTRQALTMCQGSGPFSLNAALSVIDTDAHQTITWTKIVSPGPWVTSGSLSTFPATKATVGGTGSLTPATSLTYSPTITSGTDSFVIKVSDGLTTSTDTIIMTILPVPILVAPITGSTTSVCVGATISLTDATTGGTWQAQIGNGNVSSIGVVTGVTAGPDIISYTVTNACTSTTVITNITVNPLPDAGIIVGPANVCMGGTTTYTDAVSPGTWSTGGTLTSISPSGVVTPSATGSDVITFTYTNVCGTDVTTLPVTVVAVPFAGSITGGSSTVCETATLTLTDATPGGVWSSGSTINATVSGGVVTGVGAGADIISYTFTNVCGSDVTTYPIAVLPAPHAGTITGPTTNVCVAGTLSVTDATAGGTWSATTGNASVVSGLVSGLSAGADLISYAITNSCGTDYATYPINVVTSPSAGTISGPTSVCVAATVTLSNAVLSGIWTESTGNASVSATGDVMGLSAGTDILTYTVTYSCGVAAATYNMTINPRADSGTIIGYPNLCIGGSGTTLSDAAPGGIWSSSNTSVATVSGGAVSSVALGVANILYSVTNGCGTTSAIQTVSVNAVVTPKVSYSASSGIGFTSCAGTVITFSTLPVNGGSSPTFQWSVNGTVVGSGATYSYAPANGDVVLCTMTSSLPCVTSVTTSYSKTMIVNPVLTPTVTISAGIYTDTVCTGMTPTFTQTSANGGTTPVYDWYVNGTYTASGTSFSHTLVYPFDNGDIISCIMTSNYVCPASLTAASNNVTMTVDALLSEVPKLSVTTNPGNAVCSTTPVTFIATTLYGGITPLLRWTKNGVNIATGPTYTYLPSNGDMVHCMLESSSGCLIAPSFDSIFTPDITMSVLAEASPHVSISAPLGTSIGVGESLNLTATVTNPTISMTFQWQENGVNVPGATSNTYTFNQATAGTTIVTCVVTSGDVCNYSSISNLVSITVGGLAVAQQGVNAGGIKLTPNPNKGSFSIEGVLPAENKQVTIEIMNVVGQIVYKNEAPLQNGVLNTLVNMNSELANGVYLLHIISNDQHNVIRFSVSK